MISELKALTGALLQSPSVVFSIIEEQGIDIKDFDDPVILSIWKAAWNLRANRKHCDIITISGAMGGDEAFNVVNLSEYVSLCPSIAHARHYAAEVAEHQKREKIRVAAQRALKLLDSGIDSKSVAESIKESTKTTISDSGLARITSCKDYMETMLEEPPMIISGLLRAGQVGMMNAGSKAGKSWGLISLACAVATGKKWMDRDTTLGRALYINAELSEYDMQQRIKKICETMSGGEIPSTLDVWHIKGKQVTIGSIIPHIVERQEEIGARYSLIIPDPLYSFHGDRDENSNTEMALSMGELSKLSEVTGAAIWISHHFSKGSQAGKDHLDRGSGAGVLSRAPDTIMTMTQHDDDDAYIVDMTCRSFVRPESFVVRWNYPLWEVDSSADPTKYRKQAGRPSKHNAQQIVDLLDSSGATNSAWKERASIRLGMSKGTFDRLLREAKDKGLVRVSGNLYFPEGDIL